MIGFIRGILADKGNGYVVVDVNGVGYEVFVPGNSKAYLHSEGEEVMLYTSLTVREDDMSLYGFSRKGELEAFKKLVTVNGVGSKAGLAILSAFTLEQLQEAIIYEDVKGLTKANGIGKKTAERIVLELKDKFGIPSSDMDTGSNIEIPAGIEGKIDARNESIAALIALGYSRGEATSALAKIKGDDMSSEDYIKAALRNLI